MDVSLFGPSLAAFGELCEEANLVLNGDSSSVKVLIHADIKVNCVTVQLQVVQSVWEAIKGLAENKDAASAKNLLEWLGIIGVPGSGSLVKFLVRKKDRPAEVVRKIVQKDGNNLIEIRIQRDNNTIQIAPEVFRLASSPAVVDSVRKFVAPISGANGITEAAFYESTGPGAVVNLEDAVSLQQATVGFEGNKQRFTAHITVYAPVLDTKAKLWRFIMGDEHPYMDISETTIAADTMGRGGVRTGDSYSVEIEREDRGPGKGPKYVIKKVIEFRPGKNAEQKTLC